MSSVQDLTTRRHWVNALGDCHTEPSSGMEVSVIVPTYRPTGYLWECLRSLENQTFPKERFEVLVVFNGDIHPYADELADRLGGFQINVRLLHTDLQGVSHARNVGLIEATGKYFCFIDDDDWVSSNYIANLHGSVQDHTVVASNLRTYKDGEYGEDYITRAFSRNYRNSPAGISTMQSLLSTACAKLIPREVVGEARFDRRFSAGEDSLFMALISSRIRNVVLATPDTVYYRRLTHGSASRRDEPITERLVRTMRVALFYPATYLRAPRQYSLLFMGGRFARTFRVMGRDLLRAVRKTLLGSRGG